MSKSQIINFIDIKPKIIAALEDKNKPLPIAEAYSLVDGFVKQPFSMEMTNSIVIGGPTIPMIMLLGASGQIYFFALKAIVKDLGNI